MSAALPPPCFVPCTAVYSQPFHRVTHKCNFSKGRNCLRHCRRLALCLAPPFIPNRFSVLRIMQHFKRSEQSAALPPCFVPRTAVYTRPFHRVKNTNNVSKGRNCLRHCRRLALCLAPPFIPNRFTVLHINVTFQKVGIVCGTAAALLCASHRRLFPTVSACYE